MENSIGKKYGQLTALRETDERYGGCKVWEFLCDCGKTKHISMSAVKSGNTKSCGCLKKERLALKNKTHGLSNNSAYSNWKDMFKRCYNKNNKRYEQYSGRGIIVCDEFKSFPVFLKEIGEKPEDGKRWSVGRINNNIGYLVGNIRWETDKQQARNHSKQKNNTSGITGISLVNKVISGKSYETFIATFVNELGVKITKNFSTNKYGFDKAKALAISFREKGLLYLNSIGEGYADSHGDSK